MNVKKRNARVHIRRVPAPKSMATGNHPFELAAGTGDISAIDKTDTLTLSDLSGNKKTPCEIVKIFVAIKTHLRYNIS